MSDEVTLSDIFYSTDESEPQETPTDEPVEESPEETEVEESTEVDDTEESELEDQEDAGEDQELLYIDLDGEEVSLDQVREWKAGHMKDADYTQKTQKVAADRKALEEERNSFNSEREKLSELSAQLEVLIAEDDEIDWNELREYEPERYIELKEKADKRKKALDEIKAKSPEQEATNQLTQEELQAESDDLFTSQGWKDKDGKLDEAKYKKDQEMLLDYLNKQGYSQEEYSQINRAHHFKTLLDAARYQLQQKKGSALKKKVKAAPKVTKPKPGKSPAKSAADVFYSK